MLTINNIFVRYGSFEALHGVSLEVKQGEIIVLLGSNGAGKTTTINTVSGLLSPRSGSVHYKGEDITYLPAHKRAPMGLVQVPEGRKLFPEMSVYENLLVGSYDKRPRAKRKESFELCYSLFPKVYERRNQLAGSLSGGERQMCAVCRALMQCPELLMLDEPSLGLAPVVVQSVFESILKINKLGMTILLVEQNVRASLEIATRGYVIETGQNVISGAASELSGNEKLQKAYLGI
ncbi:MAG: ABC transporter ATP-binding protein [Synergistaceae bacterium]|jgi:branched-chain amino acid transport system ATP-binding protein|nr:ABC transporter ATP-binding protein [Synergistaceae bacterium]